MVVIEGRTWLEILSPPACAQQLAAGKVGRLALLVDGHPEIFPINYAVDDRGQIYFRTDRGTKLDAISEAGSIAFEIDGFDGEDRSGWSVMVVGRAERVRGMDDLNRARDLPLEPWAVGEKPHLVRLVPDKTTGRRLHPAHQPDRAHQPEDERNGDENTGS